VAAKGTGERKKATQQPKCAMAVEVDAGDDYSADSDVILKKRMDL
jgi:hypothetical protein